MNFVLIRESTSNSIKIGHFFVTSRNLRKTWSFYRPKTFLRIASRLLFSIPTIKTFFSATCKAELSYNEPHWTIDIGHYHENLCTIVELLQKRSSTHLRLYRTALSNPFATRHMWHSLTKPNKNDDIYI
jgi:hypothetical protein